MPTRMARLPAVLIRLRRSRVFMKAIYQRLSSMEKREGAAACGARHVLVAQSGSLQIFDRALGVVREKGIDAEFGIVPPRSEEHTSELQSLMRISYAVFCF